jgi:hypothetical protein
MPKKGEKLSPEHLAKLQAGRKAKKGGSQATAPAKPEDGDRLTSHLALKQPKEATQPLIAQGQVPNLTKKKKANIVEGEPPVVRRRGGVQSSGEPAAIQDGDYLKNSNTGASILISNELPGQRKAIKRSLEKKIPKLPNEKFDADPPNTTVDSVKGVDMASLTPNPKAPFSFAALRSRLLC